MGKRLWRLNVPLCLRSFRGVGLLLTPPTSDLHVAPPVSIVIRTLNAAETLGEVLLKLQPAESDQLIVVDSGSTDGTVELARRYSAEILVIRKEDFTYGRALNRGFSAARHEWVLSLSAHTIPADPFS